MARAAQISSLFAKRAGGDFQRDAGPSLIFPLLEGGQGDLKLPLVKGVRGIPPSAFYNEPF